MNGKREMYPRALTKPNCGSECTCLTFSKANKASTFHTTNLLSWHMARVGMRGCLWSCKGYIICVETPVHVGLVADRPE